WLAPLAVCAFLAGCGGNTSHQARPPESNKVAGEHAAAAKDDEAEIQEGLAKLSPEDRKLAEQQKFCAARHHPRLGSMGVPFKLMVKDQPVFLCCKSCQRHALEDPDKTLAKVAELKAKSAGKREP